MFTENEENRRMMSWGRGSYDATPICRCRVLYLGSAVPHVTKDGLQGIQEPLRELYPEQGALGARGIDSWLSVWSNGILLENVDENHKKVTRFFPIESLHYCAAVRYVLVPEKCAVSSSTQPRFLPLDSPFARSPNPNHPPLFACILRRTTGIKVLECHTFICKREMAANALVRCCFHAYADCAYAKHIDGGGDSSGNGVYGTLGREQTSSSSDKVDGWRWNSVNSVPPATLTLDSSLHTGLDGSTLDRENSNSADDLSVYNGDENHKIWVGAQRERSSIEENVYGEWSAGTMKSSRSARPRQVINAPPPPPPPTKEVKQAKKAAAKDKSKRKKSEISPREEVYPVVNGSPMRAGTWRRGMSGSQGSLGPPYPPHPNIYANGTLLRPASRATNGGPPPPPIMVPMTLPHRPGKGFRPPPPPLVPPHALYIPAPAPVPRKHYQVTREEPVYMPSARPMSPVSSYQPCHFPHEAYLMRHYATMDYPTPKKKKDKKPKNGPVGVPAPLIITNGRADGDEWSEVGMYHRRSKEEKNGKASSMSVNAERRSDGSDSPFDSDAYRKKNKQDTKRDKNSPDGTGKEDDEEDSDSSPFNTGIYKRKGHLNERAFSYSIRQEHRSRSYGSLANLKFAPLPVVPNGGGPPVQQFYGGTINKEEMKKEREIMQMMQDLDLSADEIERSEVSPSVYQAKQRNAKIRR